MNEDPDYIDPDVLRARAAARDEAPPVAVGSRPRVRRTRGIHIGTPTNVVIRDCRLV